MKEWIIRILFGLIGLVIGYVSHTSPVNSTVESEKKVVDSLQHLVDTVYVDREVVKWKIKELTTTKEIRVDSVKNLPTTEALEYLNRRLSEKDSE